MNLNSFHNIYFLGIGGIGMSALARYFKTQAKHVAGYDRTPTTLTAELSNEGIDVHYDDSVENIPAIFKNKADTLVILTPAIPRDHVEWNYLKNNGFTIHKRSEVLGAITQDKRTIAVAGTHGKTTVSTLISHIFKHSEFDCTAFLGGISKNYSTNLLLSAKSDYMVVEADEFDRSFLQLYPWLAVVTSADADHLDIYGTVAQMKESFHSFILQIVPGGNLVIKLSVDLNKDVNKNISVYTYSLEDKADFYARNIQIKDGLYYFDAITPSGIWKDLCLGIPGQMNLENAVATIAAAILTGLDEATIRKALKSFSGVKRRFDFQVNNSQCVYIDDYAHHPEELRASINSVRKIYPGKKITGIFQPHLFSRTRDLADGFAASLGLLDELILLDIYPARELPIEGVTSALIFDKVKLKNKILCAKNELLELIKNRNIEVLLTLGAGDIDKMVRPIRDLLTT